MKGFLSAGERGEGERGRGSKFNQINQSSIKSIKSKSTRFTIDDEIHDRFEIHHGIQHKETASVFCFVAWNEIK